MTKKYEQIPMKIGMRSKEIIVPENEPFENDLLNRQQTANDLTTLVGNIETPAAVVIDGAWGTGKTTFLNLWEQSLLNDDRPVVHFNAWENDYSVNAFVSILSELTNQIRRNDVKFGLKDLLDDATVKFFKEVAVASVKIASSGVLSLDSLINQHDILAEHELYKERLEKFKANLKKLAASYKSKKNYPLVIVIDELDRCRPTFTIDILEVAKHLFSTDGVVFVLALNQRQLCHSVASMYGGDFDALGYLERFVEVTFHLPPVGRRKFLFSELSEKCQERYDNDREFRSAIEMLFTVYALPDFNLRTASHYIRRLDYVLASIGYDKNGFFMYSLVVALVTRSIDRVSYLRFYKGEISDEEFATLIWEHEGLHDIRHSEYGALIEAIVIAAQLERERKKMNDKSADVSHASSLFMQYREIKQNPMPEIGKKAHAENVMSILGHETISKFSDAPPLKFGKLFFRAVELIEMISPTTS